MQIIYLNNDSLTLRLLEAIIGFDDRLKKNILPPVRTNGIKTMSAASRCAVSDIYCLTPKKAYEKIGYYGFAEVGDVLQFLRKLPDAELSSFEIALLREKLEICLKRHDDGSDYFISLREFATEIDCIISAVSSPYNFLK